jgi:hypothetical protein
MRWFVSWLVVVSCGGGKDCPPPPPPPVAPPVPIVHDAPAAPPEPAPLWTRELAGERYDHPWILLVDDAYVYATMGMTPTQLVRVPIAGGNAETVATIDFEVRAAALRGDVIVVSGVNLKDDRVGKVATIAKRPGATPVLQAEDDSPINTIAVAGDDVLVIADGSRGSRDDYVMRVDPRSKKLQRMPGRLATFKVDHFALAVTTNLIFVKPPEDVNALWTFDVKGEPQGALGTGEQLVAFAAAGTIAYKSRSTRCR